MPAEVKQALFRGSDSSRDRLDAAGYAGDNRRSVSVEAADGTRGSATLRQTGSFIYVPYETPASTQAQTCRSCRASASSDLEVTGGDLIGASYEGSQQEAFRIWYSPVVSGNSPRVLRSTRKSAVFTCQSPAEAMAMVTAVRAITSAAAGSGQPRHFHVVLNPVSGPGRALQDYHSTVQPALEASGIRHELHVTHAAGHATDILRNLTCGDVDKPPFDAVLMMGGDGTVHEALQGILGHRDWQTAATVPFALLPAGSGNALSANTGMWTLDTALHAVVKGQTAKMDVFSILQPSQERRFGFLSVAFGLIANLDIGTEHLRFLGGARFTLGALHQIMLGRMHRLRLAYFPAKDDTSDESHQAAHDRAAPSPDTSGQTEPNSQTESGSSSRPPTPLLDSLSKDPTTWSESSLPQGWRQLGEEDLQLFAACNMPLLDMSYNLAPQAGLNTGCLDIISTIGRFGRLQGLDFMLKSDSGQHLNLPGVRLIKAEAVLLEPVSKETWLVVDGEVVPFTRLALQVHPGLCTVFVAPKEII